MSFVKKPEQVSLENVVFSDLKKQGKGGHLSFINYKDGDKSTRLIIQTPKMFSPFGASTFKKDGKPDINPKYTVQLSLDTTNKKIKTLKTLLAGLDKLCLKTASKDKNWLKQLSYKNKKGKKSSGIMEDLEDNKYTTLVKESRNEKYPDTVAPKVPIDWKTSSPALQLYGKNKNKLDVTYENIEQLLPKFAEVKALLQISHVWFVSGKFGITIKILQGVVFAKESLSGLQLLDDSDDEESEAEEESDEESEDEVEVESDSDDEE